MTPFTPFPFSECRPMFAFTHCNPPPPDSGAKHQKIVGDAFRQPDFLGGSEGTLVGRWGTPVPPAVLKELCSDIFICVYTYQAYLWMFAHSVVRDQNTNDYWVDTERQKRRDQMKHWETGNVQCVLNWLISIHVYEDSNTGHVQFFFFFTKLWLFIFANILFL